MRRMTRAVSAGIAVLLLASACSGGDDTEETTDDNGEAVDEDGDDTDVDEESPVADESEGDDEPEEAVGAEGPFRLGWVLSYLSPEYAMADLYTSSGGSNLFGYANPDFDAALGEANAAPPDEADVLYQEAEDILLADMPILPMWYGVVTSVWGEKVSNVVVDPSTYLRVEVLESEDGQAAVDGCSVQAALIPADTREACGGRLISQMFSGLVEPSPETGEPRLVVAESVETEDSVEWTVTLNEGWTFHDGTPVTAASFVDAWNFSANPDNGLRGQNFFSQIAGFSEMGGDTTELAGLEVVDDLTIEITLSEPFAPFLTKLSDSSFFPLPEGFYDDPEAFGAAPVGNGRFQAESVDVEGDVVLTRFEDWAGDTPATLEQVTFRHYQDIQTAYLDVQAGDLDVLVGAPPTELGTVEDIFGDRTSRTPSSSFTFLGFPMYDETFGDNPELRQALSLAVNRQEIIDVIFDGAHEPATAVIPPVLSSHRADACEFCTFDPERAQELFEEAGGYDDTMVFYFDSGAQHEEWIEAVANQWREVLGIEDVEFRGLGFAQYLDVLSAGAGF